MSHQFLSDEWFQAVAALRDEIGDIEVPAALQNLKINLEVRDAPDGGTIKAHFSGDGIKQGHAEGAPTTLKLPYDTARKIFVDQDQSAGMQAFMSGKIQVDGDMSKLMAMQGAGQSTSAGAAKMLQRIKEITV